jgi:hypothetical protein
MLSDSFGKKQLAGLAFNGLRYYLKQKLEDIQFFTLAQLHQRALACESRSKETTKAIRHNVHIVECDQSSSDDESTEVYAAEMVCQNRPNLRLVPPYNRFRRNNKSKLNLHLMWSSVTRYSMNYSKMVTLR